MASELAKFFREYINDYLTVERFAEDHEISVNDARTLIDLGRKYHELGY